MTKEELDFIGSMNMCDEISNEAYKKIVNHVEETEISDDCVSLEVYKQVTRERDIAIEQLKELGYEFGEKIRTSDDCVSRAEIIDELNRLGRNAFKDDTDYDNFFAFVDSLPPVTPTFPKGATNGDVIKAMFDCQEDEKQWGNDNIWVTFKAKNNPSHNFDLDWWNAPYKRGSDNG